MSNRPFYRKLYIDLVRDKYPDKELVISEFLKKQKWTALDVIEVNELLFGSDNNTFDILTNKKHRAYDELSIVQILDYQGKNMLSNIEIANKYGLSRNTIAKWKKLYKDAIHIKNTT